MVRPLTLALPKCAISVDSYTSIDIFYSFISFGLPINAVILMLNCVVLILYLYIYFLHLKIIFSA